MEERRVKTKQNCVFRTPELRQCLSRFTIRMVLYTRNLFQKVKFLVENTIYKLYIVCGQELFLLDLNFYEILLHDNAPPHKTKKVREFKWKNRFRILLIYHHVAIFCFLNWKLPWKERFTIIFELDLSWIATISNKK